MKNTRSGYNRIRVVPNGINPEYFKPGEKEKKILIVTRLFERKGVQYVIDAMNDIKEYELVICGEGPYKQNLMKQIKGLNAGNIHLMGYVSPERLKFEYETSSIFILPSSSENFPVVLLEAMSAGCAIITSNTTGCPEVTGNTALLVNPGESAGIKEALNRYINDDALRKSAGIKARERVLENFTWEKITEQYISIYNSVLNHGGIF